jgi:hypothetical protein
MKRNTPKIIVVVLAMSLSLGYAQLSRAPGQQPGPQPPRPNLPPPGEPAPPLPRPVEGPGVERSRTLVIPANPAESQDLSQLEEDINVMARILDKATGSGEDRGKLAMGINIQNSIFGGGQTPRNMYLEGYGAIFILNVPFPLVPPAKKTAEPQDKQETSSEWDEARQELYSALPQGFALDLSSLAFAGRFGSPLPYDETKVEELKESLVAALRNAVHIRKLKGDEQVVVVVNGGGASQAKVASARTRDGVNLFSHATDRAQGSRMIIKASRSDIEALNKGKLNAEEFRKRAVITMP